MDEIIRVENLTHTYSAGTPFEHCAVDGMDLSIYRGEFLGIIGHTGSGKSTLIQHLNGLVKPAGGVIYYNGRDIWDEDFSRKELRTKVGLVFQYPEHQLFETTVVKDVEFGPRNMKLENLEVQLRTFEALKTVGISDELYDASPFDLSGGQKRRVAIAGVLAMKPEVLVLDEPTAGLDPAGRDEILEAIFRIKRERNITVILVSHSMEDVARFVDRIIVMEHGSVKYDGSPKEVFRNYKELEEIGLAAPDVTYLTAMLRERGVGLPDVATTVEEAADMIERYCKH